MKITDGISMNRNSPSGKFITFPGLSSCLTYEVSVVHYFLARIKTESEYLCGNNA